MSRLGTHIDMSLGRRYDFGSIISAQRIRLAQTQEQAADALGVNRVTFRLWERAGQIPSLQHLQALASWCDLTIPQLLQRAGIIDTRGELCPTCGGTGILRTDEKQA